MIRLGVRGGGEDWADAARRLRGVAPGDDAVVLLAATADDVDALLAAGKGVLLADESALSPALLARAGPRLSVQSRDRFRPSRVLVRQQLGRLGDVGLVRLHRRAAEVTPAHLLRDLDCVLGLVGRPARLVHALRHGPAWQAHLGFDGGGMALVAHAAGRAFASGHSSLSVVAAHGAAYADDQADESALALACMAQDYVDALAAGADFAGHAGWWRGVLAVRDAALASLERDRPVTPEGA